MKINKKVSVFLLSTAVLATVAGSQVGYADDSSQALFGTEPVVVSEKSATETENQLFEIGVDYTDVFLPEVRVAQTKYRTLDDYSYYVGVWRVMSTGDTVNIDAMGKVYWNGVYSGQIKTMTWSDGKEQSTQIAIDRTEIIEQLKEGEWMPGGSPVIAAPAGTTLSRGGDGDTTKDRLFINNGATVEFGANEPIYREADYLAMTSGASEVVKESNLTDNQVVSVKESQTVSASADSQDTSETVPTSKTTQSTKAKNTSRPLPNTGEKTGLLMSVLGGLILTLGVIGVVIRRKKSY